MSKILRVPKALRRESAYERAEKALQKRFGSSAVPLYERGILTEIVVLERGRHVVVRVEDAQEN